MDAIVAIGVSHNPSDDRKMLAIAAGRYYSNLDATQCIVHFVPTRFKVFVGVTGRNITVSKASDAAATDVPMYSSPNLTQVLMRQIELISNDQTNLYVSLVGSSLNASIGDYITANKSQPLALGTATLPGLENAFSAMLDDMLVAYASAQLVIAGSFVQTEATVTYVTLRVGQDIWIHTVCAVNLVVGILVLFEAVRTRGWRRLPTLDYLDSASLIVASARGAIQSASAQLDELEGPHTMRSALKVDGSIVLERRRGFKS